MNINAHALNHELHEFHDDPFGVGQGDFQEFATVRGIDRSACPNPEVGSNRSIGGAVLGLTVRNRSSNMMNRLLFMKP